MAQQLGTEAERLNNAWSQLAFRNPMSVNVQRAHERWIHWWDHERPLLEASGPLGIPAMYGRLRGWWEAYRDFYAKLPPPLPGSTGAPHPRAVKPTPLATTNDVMKRAVEANKDAARAAAEIPKALPSAKALAWVVWGVVALVVVRQFR